MTDKKEINERLGMIWEDIILSSSQLFQVLILMEIEKVKDDKLDLIYKKLIQCRSELGDYLKAKDTQNGN